MISYSKNCNSPNIRSKPGDTVGSNWSEPLSLDRFGGEFRMPSGEKKGAIDERAEEVFGGIQA
jgi:hypothetical protein